MQEKVQCPICGGLYRKITWSHLKMHGLTVSKFEELYPGFLRVSESLREEARRKQTGKKASQKTRDKLSEVLTGRTLSDDHKLAISKASEGKPKSPEAIKAMADTKKGVSLTDDHKLAISKGLLGRMLSDEHKIKIREGNLVAHKEHPEVYESAYNEMRGGHDILKHHFIYDHNNPDQHVVEITRAEHTSHHNWMRRNGLEVPHYNVTEENKDIFKWRNYNV